MAEEIKRDITELTLEEKATAWKAWVRSEVNAALDIYLDVAEAGNINVRYYPHVVERLETGDQVDKNKADGVLLSVEFVFEEPIDLTKPRIEDEEE